MVIYFLLLAFIMMLLSTTTTSSKSGNTGFYISIALLVLFAGFRNITVGTDTGNYVYYFVNRPGGIFSGSNIEKGFLVLQTIAQMISLSYWSLLTLIALTAVSGYAYLIRKVSVNVPISFFVYITLGAYLFFFNGARQGLAAGVFAVALVFLLKRKLMWYVIWVLIASLFHRTVLIMLPFYFLLHFKYSTGRMILFSFLSFIGLSFLSFFISFFDEGVSERYGAYIDRGASGGFLLGLFFFVLSITLIYFRRRIPIQVQKTYDVYLNLCVFNSLIYLVVIIMGVDVNFLRFSQYFLAGYVLIWPLIFKYTDIKTDALFKYLFYMLHLGFYGVYLAKMSSMIPYLFNLELFVG